MTTIRKPFLDPLVVERLSEPLDVVDQKELKERLLYELDNDVISPMEVIKTVLEFVDGVESDGDDISINTSLHDDDFDITDCEGLASEEEDEDSYLS